ncbi:hypothetical protein RhiJN_26579 [Ceratobasidium sp. AG-Ba]|nr:hypothetical protein RhiJN_26579 [Ceratobasidium sp. AG-Ba]
MSKLISSFGSSQPRNAPQPVPLNFGDGWGIGSVFDWYNSLSDPHGRSIDRIQIWKYIAKPVPHRFIVVHMSEGENSIHRFDRRPARDQTNTVDLLSNQAVACEDAYQPNVDIDEIAKSAICEIELDVGGKVDLMVVLSACYAISSDNSTQKYSFLRYNCFFFSWTILMVVARRCLPYQLPQAEKVVTRFYEEIDDITEFILHESIDFFRDLVIEVLTIFRDKAGKRLHVGMNPIAKLAWGLPTSVIRFLWRRLFSLRLHLGLRKELASKIQTEIRKSVKQVQDTLLSMEGARELLDEHLWIDDTKDPLKEVLKKEANRLIWKAVLEAISAGLGSFTPEEFAAELANSNLKFSVLGRNAAQYTAVWNAGLHGGLQAVKAVSETLDGSESHQDVFEKAWNSARKATLYAAQTVVKNTSKLMKQPQRDQMWDVAWEIWDDCWDHVHKIVQPRSVKTVDKVMERLISSGVIAVVQDMKMSRDKMIKARTPSKELMWLPGFQNQSKGYVTNAELQDYMHKMIEQDTISANTLSDVHSSMARVWKATLQPLPLPALALAVITENITQSVAETD